MPRRRLTPPVDPNLLNNRKRGGKVKNSERPPVPTDDELDIDRIKKYISDKYDIKDVRELAFLAEYVRSGGNGQDAYIKVYGATNHNSARVLASNLLAKLPFADLLEYAGVGITRALQVMNTLSISNPDAYMKHYAKLSGIAEKMEIKHSGVSLPVINIYTSTNHDTPMDEKDDETVSK